MLHKYTTEKIIRIRIILKYVAAKWEFIGECRE